MALDPFIAFTIFTVVAAGTPGPSNALLTAIGAKVGVPRGLPALVGVAIGMGLLMFVLALGLGATILSSPILLTVVKWAGAATLCWLAWKIATSGSAGAEVRGRPLGLLEMAAFQWMNPKSWLVCASAVAMFLDRSAGNALLQSATLGMIFALVSLPSCFVWLAFGAGLQRFLQSERASRVFNCVMGTLLFASVILFIW